eukprot:TRINITY_DN1958_c0_g1_i5.p1 TRINITY_DN1958_c0_g1~~TRINITY_DN1958_c0_g1_i5.p1  ORF type:complete len:437 (-),score=67.67 TRINITY_DN1958_c0_g1_i5:402-1712(-)
MLRLNFKIASVLTLARTREGSAFVPTCIADKCSSQVLALGTDAYTRDAFDCVVGEFGPCASKAWACLGDETCQTAAKCAPKVFDTCKADIWKIMTNEKEREIIMCLQQCPVGKDGHHNPLCVLEKCGSSAVKCLGDATCRHVIECVPQAVLSCSEAAFSCVFGSSGVCFDNVKCLGNGLAQCAAPGVNLLTDNHIADLVTCAHNECPHPQQHQQHDGDGEPDQSVVGHVLPAPIDAVTQLVCIQTHCPLALPKILLDQDSKDLLSCVGKTDFEPAWKCLGEAQCQQALSCWAKPLEKCTQSVWQLLTDDVRRKQIEASVGCLRTCEKQHPDDFVDAGLCIFDQCSQSLVDCAHDDKCATAVKCFPDMIGDCAIPTMENYLQEPLFRDAVKAFSKGAEMCGKAAVEMLRDEQVADAVRCAASCTRKPGIMSNASVFV